MSDPVHRAASIGMNQTAQESLWIGAERDAMLPWIEPDAAEMLSARRVLRKQARPVLRIGVQLGASDAPNHPDGVARHHGPDRGLALRPDRRIGIARSYAQLEHRPRRGTDRPVTQVLAQQVGVCRLVDSGGEVAGTI